MIGSRKSSDERLPPIATSVASSSPAALLVIDDDPDMASRIVGDSLPMQEIYKKIGKTAPLESTVLILGEGGTGKELVARTIYRHSNRRLMPMLVMNCSAIPETILESELFGHEQGAFTEADRRRVGKFELANGGTVFLNGIGDMSFATQSKLLRLLQEQQFERLGGNNTVQSNVRIIATTNRDLNNEVEQGRFRQDLLLRLNGSTIRLPPLREHLNDIPALTEHFVTLFNRQFGKEVLYIAPATVNVLQRHHWPGNVREFRNAIRYALLHARGDVLNPEYLPETCLPGYAASVKAPLEVPVVSGEVALGSESGVGGFPFVKLIEYVKMLLAEGESDLYDKILKEVDRHVLFEAMKHYRKCQLHVANRLGISRMTLRSKLKSFGMLLDRRRNPSP